MGELSDDSLTLPRITRNPALGPLAGAAAPTSATTAAAAKTGTVPATAATTASTAANRAATVANAGCNLPSLAKTKKRGPYNKAKNDMAVYRELTAEADTSLHTALNTIVQASAVQSEKAMQNQREIMKDATAQLLDGFGKIMAQVMLRTNNNHADNSNMQ
jgi:hypothetical protein